MKTLDLVEFSARAIAGHRLRTALSVLGVGIGVASVIVLTSLGEGARLYVTGEFSSLGTNLLIVLPGKTETTGGAPLFGGVPNDLTLDDLEALRRHVPLIRRATPLTLGEAEARTGDRSRTVTVVGTTSELMQVRHLSIGIGRFLPPGKAEQGERVAVIGSKLQRELFAGRNPLGEVLHLGGERFRVIGVIAPRGVSLGMDMDEVVEVPVSQAMRMFNQRGLFRMLLEVSSHEEIPAAREAVIAVLRDRHGEEDVTVLTQDAVLAAFSSILSVLTAAIAGIAAISLAVAGVAIMNVMLVSVSERTPEVGLLKALGVTRRQVIAAFLLEAALLSTAGGLAGMAAGLGGAHLIGVVFPSFPVDPPTWAVASALAVSVTVGVVFGALPARRASRLDPVAALSRK